MARSFHAAAELDLLAILRGEDQRHDRQIGRKLFFAAVESTRDRIECPPPIVW